MKINLKNIEYTDSINKKSIFDNEQSSLTLLSFKSGSQRDLHCDEKDEVAQIIEGQAIITIGNEEFTLGENEICGTKFLATHSHKCQTM